ncbi:MAG: hypothetical protein AAGB13_01775 [Cyanobacteria bacterium P01_F01_bin.33]
MNTDIKSQQIYADEGELNDEQLVELIGEDRLQKLKEFDDGAIPTLVCDFSPSAPNFFIKFKSREDLQWLIHALTDELVSGTDELCVSCTGKVVSFRETWDNDGEG